MKFRHYLIGMVSSLLILSSCEMINNQSSSEDVNTESESSTTPIDSSTTENSSSSNKLTAPNVDYPSEIPILEEDSIQIHYKRNDYKYDKWSLWLWHGSAEGKEYKFNYQDDFGVVASYALSEIGIDIATSSLGFIVCQLPSWKKDGGDDRFVDFNTLEKDENGVYHVYLFTGDANVYTNESKTLADKI